MSAARDLRNLCTSERMKSLIGLQELKDCSNTWRQIGAECLGTFLLVLVGCGSTVEWSKDYKPSEVEIALAFGLIVACVIQVVGPVSGAHVNPAVTAGMLAGGHLPLARALLYVMAQCAGAVVASAVLKVFTPVESSLGVTSLNVTPLQGSFVEALITFVLVMTVFGSSFGVRRETPGSAPFAIGLSVTACHLFAIPYTGASMNPARSFGPAVIKESWNDHWVYWVGPIFGGVVSAIVYRAFPVEAPLDDSDETDDSTRPVADRIE